MHVKWSAKCMETHLVSQELVWIGTVGLPSWASSVISCRGGKPTGRQEAGVVVVEFREKLASNSDGGE